MMENGWHQHLLNEEDAAERKIMNIKEQLSNLEQALVTAKLEYKQAIRDRTAFEANLIA